MNEILQGSVFDRINDVPDGWADGSLTSSPDREAPTLRPHISALNVSA